jgi:hypothetical protein
MEPTEPERALLSRRYIVPFHQEISERIEVGCGFLFEGHSTIAARGVEEHQIDIMNFQRSPEDGRRHRFSPEVSVTVNISEYATVYGSICGTHSADSMVRVGRRAPALLQETNQRLYLDEEGVLDLSKLNALRVAFAESLSATLRKAHGLA